MPQTWAKTKTKPAVVHELTPEVQLTAWLRVQTAFLYVARSPTHLWKERIHFKWCPTLRPFVVWVQGTREEEEEEERKLYSQKISIRFGEINSTLLVVRLHRRFTSRKRVIPLLFCRVFCGVWTVPEKKCGAATFLLPTRFNEAGTLCGGGVVCGARTAPAAYALFLIRKELDGFTGSTH